MSKTVAGLSAAAILDLRDEGLRLDGGANYWSARAELLFKAAYPPGSDIPSRGPRLGERDAWILDLRARTLGPDLHIVVSCPRCDGMLAATLNVADVSFEAPKAQITGAHEVRVSVDGYAVRARTPDAKALRKAAAALDLKAARASLLTSCIRKATGPHQERLQPNELPEDIVRMVGEALIDHDPQSEVRLGVQCATCGHEWQPALDIVRFFWAELEAVAARLEDEIDVLAEGYGWSESSLLELSPMRRYRYVQTRLSRTRRDDTGSDQ